MSTGEKSNFSGILARSVSVIFHPLLIPLYGLFLIFSVPVLGYLPFEVKRLIILIVLINNVLLPLSIFPLLKYRNLISQWSVSTRNERLIPLFFTALLYTASSYIVYRFPIPAFLKTYIFALTFLSYLTFLIYFWKLISLHSVAAGALTALVTVLTFKLFSPLIWFLIPVILVSGIMMASRLKLNYRNAQEVWSGFLTGFIVFGLFLWFF